MLNNRYKAGQKVAVYLPDGKLIKAKIIEIIRGGKSYCYLVQYQNAYALVAERDIIQKI